MTHTELLPEMTETACKKIEAEVDSHCRALTKLRERLLIKATQTSDDAEYRALQEDGQVLADAQVAIRSLHLGIQHMGARLKPLLALSATVESILRQSNAVTKPV